MWLNCVFGGKGVGMINLAPVGGQAVGLNGDIAGCQALRVKGVDVIDLGLGEPELPHARAQR